MKYNGGMAGVKEKSYEEIRAECILNYRKLYKDSLVFDLCKVDKRTRIRLQQDEIYIAETKAIKASLFLEQLKTLDNVITGVYKDPDKPQDMSGTVLKALEMKNKLLLEDLNVNKDESNALNVAFTAMSAADFESLDTTEVFMPSAGGAPRDLGADFGVSDDNDSFEARLKGDISGRMEKLERE